MMVFLLGLFFLTINAYSEIQSWTHFYQFPLKTIHSSKNEIIIAKENIPLFSQLVLSWNGNRPSNGFFSFYAKARESVNKKWGNWHHMIDWGPEIQRSFLTKSDGFTKNFHVRLETEKHTLADGFAIKIVAPTELELSFLKNIGINIANFGEFKEEDANVFEQLSHHIQSVPPISQFKLEHFDNNRMCSPTSMSMLTQFLTGKLFDPLDFAHHCFDTGLNTYGSWPFNTAHAFERSKETYSYFVVRLNNFNELYGFLKRNLPVVVSVRGPLRGAPKVYDNGHLLVVVGWDLKTREVICHDPAFSNHYETIKRYCLDDFLKAWELSHRLAYIAIPLSKKS